MESKQGRREFASNSSREILRQTVYPINDQTNHRPIIKEMDFFSSTTPPRNESLETRNGQPQDRHDGSTSHPLPDRQVNVGFIFIECVCII